MRPPPLSRLIVDMKRQSIREPPLRESFSEVSRRADDWHRCGYEGDLPVEGIFHGNLLFY